MRRVLVPLSVDLTGPARRLIQGRRLIWVLARKDTKLRYVRSILGLFWSLLIPASTLLIYITVFGIFLRVTPPVAGNGQLQSYGLFLFCGLIPWTLFSTTARGSMSWLIGAGPLLKKIYIPTEVPIIAGAVTSLTQTVAESVILILVLTFVGNIGLSVLAYPLLLSILFLFCAGIALTLSVAHVYFRDLEWFVELGMTLMFFLTPVFYPLNLVPHEIWGWLPIRMLILLNPMTQFVTASRDSLYGQQFPSASRLVLLLGVSILSFLIGALVVETAGRRVNEEL